MTFPSTASSTSSEGAISVKRDLLLPVLTGIVAIILERRIYNRSAAVRAFSGPQTPS
jgi:hypothetical protein